MTNVTHPTITLRVSLRSPPFFKGGEGGVREIKHNYFKQRMASKRPLALLRVS